MRELFVEDEVACLADDVVPRLMEYAATMGWPEAGIPYDLEVPFEELGLPGSGGFTREVCMTFGTPQRRRVYLSLYCTAIPISWHVPESRAFPEFDGWIEITPLSKHAAQISVLGHYRPPGGIIGAAFDAAAGKRIAEATIRHFLGKLKGVVERQAAT